MTRSRKDSGIRCELLDTQRAGEALLQAQQWARTSPLTVHQSADWYNAYIEAFRVGEQVRVFRFLRGGGELVGVYPLQLYPASGTRYWKLRRLVPLGQGPSDFFNLLVAPGAEQPVAAAFVEWLRAHRGEWDQIQLENIPSSSPAWKPLVDALQASGLAPEVDQSRSFYFVDATEPWAAYLERFIRPNNKDLLKDVRRLEREGRHLRLVQVREGIGAYLPQLMPIYAQRRESLGQFNRYTTEERQSFLRAVLRTHEPAGRVELTMLTDADEQVWAYQLDWLQQGTRFHWMHAYSEDYAKYSPGKLLLLKLLEQSFLSTEIRTCNFMRGESPYKSKLADRREAYVSFRLTNPWSARVKATRLASKVSRIRGQLLRRGVPAGHE